MYLRFIGRQDLADLIVLPKPEDKAGRIKEKLLTEVQVKELINKAPTFQHRLLFDIFFETGARRGEVYNLRIKDVGFDK